MSSTHIVVSRTKKDRYVVSIQIAGAAAGDIVEYEMGNFGAGVTPPQKYLYALASIKVSAMTPRGRKIYGLSDTDPKNTGYPSVTEFAIPIYAVGGAPAPDPRYGPFGHGRVTRTGSAILLDGVRIDPDGASPLAVGHRVTGSVCCFDTDGHIRLPNDNVTVIGSCHWRQSFSAKKHLDVAQIHNYVDGYQHAAGAYVQMCPSTNIGVTGIDRIKCGAAAEYTVVGGGGGVTSYPPGGEIVLRNATHHPYKLHMQVDPSATLILIIDNGAAGDTPAVCKVYADKNPSGILPATNSTYSANYRVTL